MEPSYLYCHPSFREWLVYSSDYWYRENWKTEILCDEVLPVGYIAASPDRLNSLELKCKSQDDKLKIP
jgi:hypothetical protein